MGYVILLWHSLSLPYNYFATDRRLYEVQNVFVFFNNQKSEKTNVDNSFSLSEMTMRFVLGG